MVFTRAWIGTSSHGLQDSSTARVGERESGSAACSRAINQAGTGWRARGTRSSSSASSASDGSKARCVEEGRTGSLLLGSDSRADVVRVAELIGPWLCPVKRARVRTALGAIGRRLRLAWLSRARELAWAGGLFDGEGCTYLEKHRTHAGYFDAATSTFRNPLSRHRCPSCSRLRSAVRRISGPSQESARKGRTGARTGGGESAALGCASRSCISVAVHRRGQTSPGPRRHRRASLRSPTSRAAILHSAIAGARYCLSGHDKWNARIRPFSGRGKNDEDPRDHLRQCLVCRSR